MKILSLTVGPFAENTYLVIDRDSGEALVVDPGDEAPRLLAALEGLRVSRIILTHAHLDHVGAAAQVQQATGAPLFMHKADEFLLDHLATQAAMFGLEPPPRPDVSGYFMEGDSFELGAPPTVIHVLETPGHSPGSVTFLFGGQIISGDVLFAGGIGRTDLPGGDLATLERSIREKLYTLPDETVVHPGHGPATTIGQERRSNPFFREADA